MRRTGLFAAILLSASCENAITPPLPAALPSTVETQAEDDGTFLGRIDPLGGHWHVARIGAEDFRRFGAYVAFSAGGFLNHGAGCHGGHPAFYKLEGQRLTITRREPVRTGKCPSGEGGPAAAAASERRLAGFLDQAASWEATERGMLILTARDGTRAVLERPVEPHPELAGRWIIETIGNRPFTTERRPPTMTIAKGNIGLVADCNSMGATFDIPAPGRIVVRGPVIGTQMGCPPEDEAEDDLMSRAMASATAYRLDGDRLILTGGPGMALRRPPAPDRRLVGEYRACGNTLLGGYHEGPITLSIDQSTIRDNAGCTAEYRADGPFLALHLNDGPACAAPSTPYVPGEPVAVGGDISPLAVTRPDGFAFNDEGLLILRTNRGLLTMCRLGSPPPFGG